MAGHNGRQGFSQPCRFITSPRGCSYGKNCKFSHGGHHDSDQAIQGHETNNGRSTREKKSKTTTEKRMGTWFYSTTPTSLWRPLGHAMAQFFQEAKELAFLEPGTLQEVIRALGSEGGLHRIRELAAKEPKSMESQVILVKGAILPLFDTITHPDVLASALLEHIVVDIYTFVYGPNGRRAQSLFDLVLRVIEHSTTTEAATDDTLDLTKTISTCIEVLSNIADNNQDAAINESLRGTVESLTKYIVALTSGSDSFLPDRTMRSLTRLRDHFNIADAIPGLPKAAKLPASKATFQLFRDLPGELSSKGLRHDNDFADIAKISIMPTAAEIRSERPDYLPPLDSSQWHVQGEKGLMDRHFRLLREDTIGQLRDAIRNHLSSRQGNIRNGSRNDGIRLHVYQRVQIQDVICDKYAGLILTISLEMPSQFQRLSVKEQAAAWETTKRLKPDALVSLLDSQGTPTFCSVIEPRQHKDRTQENQHTKFNDRLPVISPDPNNQKRVFVNLTLVTEDDQNVQQVLQRFDRRTPNSLDLVEFPGVLLPSFQPTLKALQTLSAKGNLPFANIIASSGDVSTEPFAIPPPTYAMKPGFKFDLSCLTTTAKLLELSPREPFDIETLQSNTSLDDAQAVAARDILTRSFAICQGPPGTGKSFLGVAILRVLLANKEKAKLGPIICVCYTNHALDQLLEHLLDHRITNIIRIGSRSKSERLADVNLRVVAANMEPTKSERKARWDLHTSLDSGSKDIMEILAHLRKAGSTSNINAYLRQFSPHHHRQLFSQPPEGWEVQGAKGDGPMATWLRAKDWFPSDEQEESRSLEELDDLNVWKMSPSERQKLHEYWTKEHSVSLRNKLISALTSFQENKKKFDKIRAEQNLRCLQQANIIGVTTTGLARNLDLLRRVRAKILCVEEAAEVLEAHILTALLPSIEHAISIGDHLQLRPQIQNYDLQQDNPRGQQYSLDMSLFERLVAPPDDIQSIRLPFSVIETQRRMHPSISRLVRNTLYPALKDDQSVQEHPKVAGMKQRLFWLDHNELEDSLDQDDAQSTSKTNKFEVEMTAALVTHLVKQGVYLPEDIAVLTPYLGQLMHLRKRLSGSFAVTLSDRDQDDLEKAAIDDVDEKAPSTTVAKTTLLQALRIATIDNFQGEEAKVVVISLVRSNPANRCGFLRTSNRVNVLLSRAKHGMYVIGNARTSGSVKMWQDVIGMLQEDNQIGPELELECPRHPDTAMAVRSPDDFRLHSPAGGCNLKCIQRLTCGHACPDRCHSNVLHSVVQCMQPCLTTMPGCRHLCSKLCHKKCDEKCGLLMKNLDITLDCGHHKTELPCWQAQDPKLAVCKTIVSKTVPGCEHSAQVSCYEDVTKPTFICNAICNSSLPCGHNCNRKCHKCRPKIVDQVVENHGSCTQTCGRHFKVCQHACREPCHPGSDCPPCKAPCEVRCNHSQCQKECSEPCTPCAEPICASCCPHSSCTMPCSAPCNWLPCSKRCQKKLACGHQCPSVCGERCPDPSFCQVCASEEILAMDADYIEMRTYGEIYLDIDPCIFPLCGHIISLANMDSHMDMPAHYEFSDDGTISAIKTSSKPFSSKDLKVCPQCRGSLRDLSRYGRIVRRAHLDEATKRFLTWANKEYLSVAETLNEEHQKLSESTKNLEPTCVANCLTLDVNAASQMLTIAKGAAHTQRYRHLLNCRRSILLYIDKTGEKEMPFARMCEVVEANRRLRGEQGHQEVFPCDSDVVTGTFHLKGIALLIRCELAILSDYVSSIAKIYGGRSNVRMTIDLLLNRLQCQKLIESAQKAKDIVRQTEGHIFMARMFALEIAYCRLEEVSNQFKTDGKTHLAQAQLLCKEYPGTTRGLPSEIDTAAKSLETSFFDAPLSTEERRDVLRAMAQEFRGTGHWYECRNGHPFSIGECGMPMQEARCPTCGERIGGMSHQVAEGVVRADELERELADLRL